MNEQHCSDANTNPTMKPPKNAKTTADSYAEQVHILNLSCMNGYGRLFGGQLMEWVDVLAATVARRHSGANVTTVAVDNLQFLEPAYANDTIFMTGTITYVGKTSMEVCVKTYLEQLSGSRKLINTAYLVLVALDKNDVPIAVPGLLLQTLEERLQWEAGEKRRALRKQRSKENF